MKSVQEKLRHRLKSHILFKVSRKINETIQNDKKNMIINIYQETRKVKKNKMKKKKKMKRPKK